jgi:hypothetical protein
MSDIWLIFGIFIFVYSIYLIWASTKISVRQDENFYRVERFEEQLDLRPGEYECILALERDAWVKANYAEVRNRIIDSPKFVLDYFIPTHYLGVMFSLKAIEKSKIIYVALGSDSYNWESPKALMRRRNFESEHSENYS